MNQPPNLDWGSIAWSLLFLCLGLYFAIFWPLSIKKKIDAGEEILVSEKSIHFLQFIGFVFSFYCLLDLVWYFFHLPTLADLVRKWFGTRG